MSGIVSVILLPVAKCLASRLYTQGTEYSPEMKMPRLVRRVRMIGRSSPMITD